MISLSRPVRTSRPARLPVVAGLAVAAAVAGGAAWQLTDKTVTLTVDGQARSVELRGDTVADVLAAAGVDAGRRDVLVPAAGREIEDGGQVALRRARELELVVDGAPRTVWVTATSVDEALDQAGLRDRGLALSASRSRDIPLDGMRVAVTTPKDVRILVDGRRLARTTTAPTARDALIEAGVRLDADDRLSVDRTRPTADGLIMAVTRVKTDRVVEPVTLPNATTRTQDSGLAKGRTKVLTAGQAGAARRTVQRTFADGRLEKRTVLSTVTVRPPVTRVVAVGTRPAPAAASSGSVAGGGSGWAAVARCESGGNPGAVSSTGKYRGLYQFSTETWRSVGGSGDPAAASAAEQTRRAQMLFARSGAGQWPECGRYLR